MRKRRKITTMDTQERYFQNSLGHPSLPTASFFLTDSRELIRNAAIPKSLVRHNETVAFATPQAFQDL